MNKIYFYKFFDGSSRIVNEIEIQQFYPQFFTEVIKSKLKDIDTKKAGILLSKASDFYSTLLEVENCLVSGMKPPISCIKYIED